MTTLAELNAMIATITMRPDRIAESTLGIQQALQIAHAKDDFPMDLVEIRIVADVADYEIQATLNSNIRKVSHIIPQYLQADGTYIRGDALNYVQPRGFNSADTQKLNKGFYYLAGNKLNIKVPKATKYFEFGYWAYPDITESGIASDWIAANWSQMIIFGAVSFTYRALGNDAAAQQYQSLFSDQLGLFTSQSLYNGNVSEASSVADPSDWKGEGGW